RARRPYQRLLQAQHERYGAAGGRAGDEGHDRLHVFPVARLRGRQRRGGQGLPDLAPLPGDTAHGAAVFTSTCVVCHGADGQGTPAAPALWGPESYNIGAGMARLRTAASFIRHNLPLGNPHLTDQQAFDVAAYINARPRPDYRGKENDRPRGNPPPDVAYPTKAGRSPAPAESAGR